MKNILGVFLYVFLLMFSVSSHASLLTETSIPNNFGVNVHFTDQNLDEHIALLKEAGFKWVRKDFSWATIEKEQGVYEFSRYDTFIDAMNNAGIKVLLILNYRNELYDSNLSPYTSIGRQAFAKFAEAAATHYASKNVAWEIYNEPNWGFWTPTPNVQNYIALARVVTQSLRRIVPHQAILAPALAGPATEKSKNQATYTYLNNVLADPVAQSWDAISIHPYRNPKNPETIYDEIPKLRKMLEQHGIKAPLVFSEWGYHTAEKGVSEEVEAAYAARSFLIANALRLPFSIWYDWQETSDDTSDSEQQYGLLRYNMTHADSDETRKPAFNAIRDLGKILNGYRFDRTIKTPDGIYCLQFKNGKSVAYALWTTAKEAQPYHLPLSNGRWQASILLAESSQLDVKDNQAASLQLQAMPLIVKRATE